MPDFERVLRKLEADLCPDEQSRREVLAYHRGLDRARKEVLLVVLVVAVAIVILGGLAV